MKKRLFAILLCLVMIVGLLPAGALAVQDTNTAETHVHSSNETAAAAAGDVTYLAFTSDIHNGNAYNGDQNKAANRLDQWLNNVTASDKLNSQIDVMGFCGDNGSAGAYRDSYWGYVQTVMDTIEKNNNVGKGVFTTGNHEYINGSYSSGSGGTSGDITRIGKAAESDDYIIYCFGPSSSSQQFTSADMGTLDKFLNDLSEAEQDKPIFILTHFPLHYISSRTISNAADLVDVLNKYSNKGYNLFYLWGHNHSQTPFDSHYDKVYLAGSTLDVSNTKSKTINFTYSAAGCMSGVENQPSQNVKGKGLVAAISDDAVTLNYYDENATLVGEGATIARKAATPAAADGVTYTLATSFEDGKNYVIANGNSGDVYVVSNEAGGSRQLKGIQATVNGDKITLSIEDAAKAAFTAVSKTSTNGVGGFWLQNGSSYLYSDNDNGLRVDASQASSKTKLWHYKADGKNVLWFFNSNSSSVSDGYTDTGSYKYYLNCTNGVFTDAIADNNTVLANTTTPAMYIFGAGDGSGSGSGEDPVGAADVALTPSTDNPSESKTIAVGETITVQLNNASEYSDYTFAVTPSKNGVVELSSESVKVEKGASGTFTITGNANGTVDINITNGASSRARTAVIHLTVGSGGDTPVVETKTYVPAYQMVDGGNYLIVSTNATGSAKALTLNGSSASSTDVQIANDKIEYAGDDAVFTASTTNNITNLQNVDGWVYISNNAVAVRSTPSSNNGWTFSDNTLKYSSRYLYFNNGSFTTSSSTKDVYLFVDPTSADPGIAPVKPQAPGENGTYVILVNGYALTSVPSEKRAPGGTGYWYYGFQGTPYTEGDSVADNMIWTVTKSDSGYTITSGGQYLNATYESNDENGKDGTLKLDNVRDIWTYSDGKLQTANATEQSGSGKFLYHAAVDGEHLISIRSSSSAGSVTFIPVTAAHTHSLTKVDAVAATCTKDGNIEYYTCTCGKIFRDAAAAIEIALKDTVIPAAHTLEKVAAVAATCTKDGNIEHWKCSVCGKLFSDKDGEHEIAAASVVVPAAHTIEKVAAVAATCTKDGNIEHWKCSVCGKLFSDQDGEHEITAASVVVPAAHTIEKVAAVAATCTKDGNIEHWKCSVCGKLFSDKEGEHEITAASVVVPAAHTLVKVAAVAPTETTTGLKEHWKCSVCGALFLDEAGTQPTTLEQVTLPVAGHTHSLTKVAAVAATCTKDGNIEYYTCTCGKIFRDASAAIEIALEDTVIPAAHTLEKVAAVAATCTKDGNIEHWKCSVCGKLFSDQGGEHEITAASVVVPAAHTIEKVAAVAATCTKDGNIEHWKCSVCGKLFSDKEGEHEITAASVVVPAAHTIEKVAAVAATCTKDGNIEHWKCSVCGKLFSDKEGEHEITAASVVVPAAHTLVKVAAVAPTETTTGLKEHWKCSVCGALFLDEAGTKPTTLEEVTLPKLDPVTEVTYTLTDKLEAGKEYLISTTKDGSGFLLSGEAGSVSNSLKGYAVNAVNGKITIDESVEAKTIFDCAGTNANSLRLTFDGQYLYADGNGALRLVASISDSGKFWHYKAYDDNGAEKRLLWFFNGTSGDYGYTATGTYKYYLSCDNSGNFTKGIADNNTQISTVSTPKIYLFVKDTGEEPTTVPVTGVTLDKTSLTLEAGKTGTLTATVAPANATNKDVTWSSNNTAVATVANGTVTAVGAGTATITVTTADGGKTANCTVTVTAPDPQTGTKYYEVSSLTAGGKYVIGAVNSDGTVSALTAGGSSNNDPVNPTKLSVTAASGNDPAYVQTSESSLVWEYTSGKNLANGSVNFYPTSSRGVMLYNRDRAITFADGHLSFETTSDGTFYITFSNGEFGTSNSVSDAATFRLFSTSDEPVTPPVGDNVVDVTPTTSVPEKSITIAVGETLTINVTNGSSREYTYTATLSKSGVAGFVDGKSSVVLAGNAEGTITVEGIADGTVDITISNGNTSSERKAIIHLTVGEGGGDPTPSALEPGTYVIVVDGNALTTVRSGETAQGGSSSYTYTGLDGVPYTEGTTPAANMVWTVEKSGDGYVITNNGKYLGGTYTSGSNSGKGDLTVSSTSDVWIYEDGMLKSANASNGQSSDKFLSYEDSVDLFSIRSSGNADKITFIKVDAPAECDHATTKVEGKKDATCTEAGYTGDTVCTKCGLVLEQGETIPATGHSFGDWTVVTAATCTKAGSEQRVCSKCGEVETREIAATGHGATELKNAKEATCSAEGYTGDYVCTVCGEVVTAGSTIAKLAHQTQVVNKKDATCTEAGYTGDTVCSVCGEIVSRGSTISALGHTTELRNAKDPTCTEKGYTGDYVCTRCGETIAYGSDIAALGHEWNDGVVTKQPSCTESGERTFTCKHDATHTRTETIDALGHQWSEWKVTVQPTETEAGFESRTCSRCGQSETREVPPIAHKHVMEAVAAVAATCETAGNEAYWHCTGCNKYFSDAEGKNEIEAPVVLPALGHKTEIRGAKDPTCAEKGYTGDEYCSVCGKLLNKGEDIPALGHKTIVQGKKDATCTETGYTGDEVCTVCGETVKKGEVIPATGHKWGDWQVTVPATEDAEGVETRVCSVCGEKETRTIAPIGHTHNMTKVDEVPATCEKDGTEAYWQCSGCGKLFADAEGNTEIQAPVVIEAPGHKLVKHDAVAPTETEAGNIEYWECSVCHKLFSDKDGKNEIKLEDTILDPTGKQPCDGGANCPSIKLTDVDRSATSFYHHAVDWAYVNDIVKGVDDTHFGPKTSCTREMMVTLLWRMNGSPEPKSMVSPFADVTNPEYYSYKAILWAAENGITKGTDEAKKLFSPKDNVTREQVVTLLWRLKGSETVEGAMQFTDVPEGRYSYEAVKWAVKEGITTGRSADSFAPGENCTRAEIVTFLWRFSGSPMV